MLKLNPELKLIPPREPGLRACYLRLMHNHFGRLWLICVAVFLLAACTTTPSPVPVDPPIPSSTPTAQPSATPVPTWTPTPIPTATPIPPAVLRIQMPDAVSGLEPVPMAVDFVVPSGVTSDATIYLTVMDPASQPYAVFELLHHEGNRYYADTQLLLPLDPLGGYWSVAAQIESDLEIEGMRVLFFVPEQIHFRTLTGVLTDNVRLRIPQAFSEVANLGDGYAGSRIWQYQDGKMGLWWAPGPTEKLMLSNAVTMLEATFPSDDPPSILDVVETQWYDRITFMFNLQWSASQPGVAWVIQDTDFWLYVLEIHALDGDEIPHLIEQVASTFKFIK